MFVCRCLSLKACYAVAKTQEEGKKWMETILESNGCSGPWVWTDYSKDEIRIYHHDHLEGVTHGYIIKCELV